VFCAYGIVPCMEEHDIPELLASLTDVFSSILV
jgi:hypothetical protein